MKVTARGSKIYHFQEPPSAGQATREALGAWERGANAQQQRLVETYDVWATFVYQQMAALVQQGGKQGDLESLLERSLPQLELSLSSVIEQGTISATNRVLKETGISPTPGVLSIQTRSILEGTQMVRTALVPHIRESLLLDIRRGVASDLNTLWQSFVALRNRIAQYAGGYWVMIFEVEKELGRGKERELARQGLLPEPVRWVLDPEAEHCESSAGFYGCLDLAGEYPGGWDTLPTVPAGQVTCRGNSVLPGNIIDAVDVEVAYRAWYSGLAVEFVTEKGVKFSVTANHPILTPHGWVAAQLLHKGDYVINSSFGKSPMVIVNQYHQHMPARIEQIWDSLFMPSVVNSCPGSIVLPDDFHGDGRFMNGYIDIVFTHRQLRGKIGYPLFAKHLDNFSLNRGLLAQGSLPPQSPGVQILDSSFASSNGSMISGNLINPLFGSHLRPFERFGFALCPELYSLSFESVGNGASAYTRILRQLQDTFACEVTLDKIVQIGKFNYSGHVYDLQTPNGYFLLRNSITQRQGIVNSNCRCRIEVFKDGKWQRGV